MKVLWRHAALASARRFMADQAGMQAVNQAVAALAENPEPQGAFIRGSYRRLRLGSYRVLYEMGADIVTVVRVDKLL